MEIPSDKKKVGRPLKWSNPEEFAASVDQYFESGCNITWAGLALHLGFGSRDSLRDYGLKEEFSASVKKALLRIEIKYEEAISKNNPAGAIFALKNFGWKDKQEFEQSGSLSLNHQFNGIEIVEPKEVPPQP